MHHQKKSMFSAQILVWTMLFLLISSSLGDEETDSYGDNKSDLDSSSNFTDNNCSDKRNTNSLEKLNKICEDCYVKNAGSSLYQNCREDCFQNDLFKTCVQSLGLNLEDLQEIAQELRESDPHLSDQPETGDENMFECLTKYINVIRDWVLNLCHNLSNY